MAARKLRLGMVGGGRGAFIGAVHRMAARLDGHYEIVAGAFGSNPEHSIEDGLALGIASDRAYPDFRTMAMREAARDDGIDAVAIVTPNHLHFTVAREFLAGGCNVICEKPLATSLADALELVRLAEATGCIFALAHNYSGYPMVREARDLVRSGALGALRVVQVEYPQDWLSTCLEATEQKQASWRTDPARAGSAGSLGDLGTHAHHLLRFITGLEVDAVCADLSRLVEGRALDDNAHVLLRLSNGARGMLWASQVCPGNENALRIRVYGEKAGLEWAQEQPNQLRFTPLGEAPRVLYRGAARAGEAARRATRLPAGHPEGYIEAFAQIYADVAELIRARGENRAPDPLAAVVPNVLDGAIGMAFLHACIASSAQDGRWVSARLASFGTD
jgi:predicted dehydrogenase